MSEAKALHEVETRKPNTRPTPEAFKEFHEHLEGQPYAHAVVRRSIQFNRVERPGDDRMMRREPEVGEVGDLVRIPLDGPVAAAQTPSDVAVLFADGTLEAVPQAAFDKAETADQKDGAKAKK